MPPRSLLPYGGVLRQAVGAQAGLSLSLFPPVVVPPQVVQLAAQAAQRVVVREAVLHPVEGAVHFPQGPPVLQQLLQGHGRQDVEQEGNILDAEGDAEIGVGQDVVKGLIHVIL